MKRKQIPQNPLLPFVKIEEILAFDPLREETFTRSEVVNAICRAFAVYGYLPSSDMAYHLGITQKGLSGAVEVAVGMNYSEMRGAVILGRLRQLKKDNPEIKGLALARTVGFKSRASLWRFLRSELMQRLKKTVEGEPYSPEKRPDSDQARIKARHRYEKDTAMRDIELQLLEMKRKEEELEFQRIYNQQHRQ